MLPPPLVWVKWISAAIEAIRSNVEFGRETLAVQRPRHIPLLMTPKRVRSKGLEPSEDACIPPPRCGRGRSSLLRDGALGLEVARQVATDGVDIAHKIRDASRPTTVTQPSANIPVGGVDVPRRLSTLCWQHRGWSIGINAVPASAGSAQVLPVMVSASAFRTTRAISPRRVAPFRAARGAALPRPLAATLSRRLISTGDSWNSSRS